MSRRVAVVGDEALFQAASEAASGDFELCRVGAGDAAPPGTAVVLGGVGDIPVALGFAGMFADQADAVLTLLARSIDSTEGINADNHRRVRDHVTRFGEALGLSSDERSPLERGALVHDIGKIQVPTDVLVKSEVLTYDDWQLLRNHTTLGADLVKAMDALRDTEDIVRYHHENWDGSGYPEGLKGEAIPRLARVMKVVDVYCAMTSPRHYRDGVTGHDEALAYFESEKGQHYDPELVDVFIAKNLGQPPA